MSRDSNEGWLQHRNNWQREIGKFLLAFGEIEWITYKLLVELPTERIFESVGGFRFSSRVDLIVQLAGQRNIPNQTENQLKRLLTAAKALSRDRNTIAHNPLYWSFFDGEGGIDMRTAILPFNKPEKEITFERLEKLANQAQKLSEDLYECFAKVSDGLSQ